MEKLQKYFLTLLLIQAMHSTEEYIFHFYDVFPLLPFMANLFQTIPQAIFFILNYQLVLFLTAIFLISFTRERWFPLAVLIFALIELLNGIFHVGTALLTLRYFPGAATGFLYFPASIWILRELRLNKRDFIGKN